VLSCVFQHLEADIISHNDKLVSLYGLCESLMNEKCSRDDFTELRGTLDDLNRQFEPLKDHAALRRQL